MFFPFRAGRPETEAAIGDILGVYDDPRHPGRTRPLRARTVTASPAVGPSCAAQSAAALVRAARLAGSPWPWDRRKLLRFRVSLILGHPGIEPALVVEDSDGRPEVASYPVEVHAPPVSSWRLIGGHSLVLRLAELRMDRAAKVIGFAVWDDRGRWIADIFRENGTMRLRRGDTFGGLLRIEPRECRWSRVVIVAIRRWITVKAPAVLPRLLS